jgi:hypothetical protein
VDVHSSCLERKIVVDLPKSADPPIHGPAAPAASRNGCPGFCEWESDHHVPASVSGLTKQSDQLSGGGAAAARRRRAAASTATGLLVMVPLLLACAAARLLATQPGVTKPTKPILDWQLNDTGCFVHYNMATMAGLQGCQDGVTAPPPISAWQPTALDTDAWVSTCKAMGGTRMIYVAKHGCGFAAWKSEVAYNYSVANAPDQTDVVAAFVESARRGGIGVGFYYSDATNSYCRVRGGVVVPGATQPGRQITVTQAQYDNVVLAHLAELWGNCDAAPPRPPAAPSHRSAF